METNKLNGVLKNNVDVLLKILL